MGNRDGKTRTMKDIGLSRRKFARMKKTKRFSFKDQDPSICKRVIKDGYDGVEIIISGPRNATFGEVCRDEWPFESVRRNSSWFIKDAKGNDVTNRSLESVDGILTLVPEYGSEHQKEERDVSDEYPSIHDSVTYYD